MIPADPAHPAFGRLSRQDRAAVYKSHGWTQTAIAEELDASRAAVRYWVDPAFREQQRAKARARKRQAIMNTNTRGGHGPNPKEG
jgi:DNA-directed RNA polymerase specialized sigma24 family protein